MIIKNHGTNPWLWDYGNIATSHVSMFFIASLASMVQRIANDLKLSSFPTVRPATFSPDRAQPLTQPQPLVLPVPTASAVKYSTDRQTAPYFGA